MATYNEDYRVFNLGLSAAQSQFSSLSFNQIQSYTGAAAFNGWSTTGVNSLRNVPAAPTLTQLTDIVKTLIHDVMAPKS